MPQADPPPAPVDPRREGLDLVVWGGPRSRIPPDLTARRLGLLAWSLCAAPSYVDESEPVKFTWI